MSALQAVADAICKADGHNPDYVSWVDYKDHARAALEAMGGLSAAAPDLLVAAQWAEKALERYSDALGLDVDEAALIALYKVKDAITKATGEASA